MKTILINRNFVLKKNSSHFLTFLNYQVYHYQIMQSEESTNYMKGLNVFEI